jgi:hypothetical protein
MKNLCIYCQKPIVAFGNARANGKGHDDWANRQLHKQCWKKQKQMENLINYLKKN